jgi:hypothetical protein
MSRIELAEATELQADTGLEIHALHIFEINRCRCLMRKKIGSVYSKLQLSHEL